MNWGCVLPSWRLVRLSKLIYSSALVASSLSFIFLAFSLAFPSTSYSQTVRREEPSGWELGNYCCPCSRSFGQCRGVYNVHTGKQDFVCDTSVDPDYKDYCYARIAPIGCPPKEFWLEAENSRGQLFDKDDSAFGCKAEDIVFKHWDGPNKPMRTRKCFIQNCGDLQVACRCNWRGSGDPRSGKRSGLCTGENPNCQVNTKKDQEF